MSLDATLARNVALVVLAYAVGSVSFALLLARRRGIDLRAIGSGNLGATNVERALGKRAGRLVLLLDAAKGALPVALAILLSASPEWVAVIGFAAAFGHCFPVWHGFRGGKGAATSAGVLLVVSPWLGVSALVTFFVAKRASRRASVGSLSGATAALAFALVLERPWGARAALAAALWLLVFVQHRENIVRLARSEEPSSDSSGAENRTSLEETRAKHDE